MILKKSFIYDKKNICVVIPIYKVHLNDFEILSVRQCIKILSDYTIIFACSEVLNVEFYEENFTEIKQYSFFENDYFNDIQGYNRLMLSAIFYKKFIRYEYVLIYQTDCFVFSDSLLDWANKGYDYIGGVWFERFIGNPHLGAKLWQAGNGGLSLRKTKKMIRVVSSIKPLKSLKQLIKEKIFIYRIDKFHFLKQLFLLPLNILGYQNNYRYNAQKHMSNEDVYFIEVFLKYNGLKIPYVEEAKLFSWDRCPDFLFKYLGHFPFACHGWFREDFPYVENKEFWSKYIKI